MTSRTLARLKSAVAVTVTAALVMLSPGVGCYTAFAQFVEAAAGRAVSITPGIQAGVGIRTAPVTLAPAALPTSFSLTNAAPALPSVLPTVRPAAAAFAAPAVAAPAAASELPGNRPGIAAPAIAPQAASPVRAAVATLTPDVKAAPAAAQGAPSFKNMLADPRSVALPTGEIASMPTGQARDAGSRMMDAVLGLRSGAAASDAVEAAPAGVFKSLLRPAVSLKESPRATVPLNAVAEAAPQGAGYKVLAVIKSVAAMGLGGAAVYAAHAAAATFLPTMFGIVPIAAVWAVSSGLLLLPISLYERYRLALRDSPRLSGVKLLFDASLGAFLGAAAVALPAVLSGAILSTPMVAMAGVAGVAFAGAAAAQKTGGLGGIFNAIAAWGALNFLAPLFGHAAVAPLTLGAVFGLAALPVVTTIAFFAGRIIASAESGRPFAVPGSMQAIRFPEYTWVMTGVVFALLTGYTPVWVNYAFMAWMFLGKTRLFNILFGAAAAWAAFTGFGAPVTFLVIAFAPERAAKAAEWALGKLLPKGEPAPSTKAKPVKLASEETDGKWPQFHFWLKTALAIGSLLALGVGMSSAVFGLHAFGVNLLIAGALSAIPFLFAKKIIKAVMKATPMDERASPEVYGIMRDLRERINKARAAKGQKPIPMPEMVDVPMPVPNAFATGRSPFNAMVGVTAEMKDMTLNPERTRAGLIRLLYITDPASKQFLVYRRGIRGSIAGISENAGPQEIIRALQKANAADVKALGVRMLRGVMGHEFNHVMHRDMLLGSIAGTIASAISFASYGVLWTVGHAQAVFTRLWEKMTGKSKPAPAGPFGLGKGPRAEAGPQAEGPFQPEAFEPVTTAVAAKSLVGLVKIFAALWGPVLATILSMASSRTREGHADESGAALTEDPESLALGLGMLISWQPPAGFMLRRELVPIIASQAHVMTVNPLEQLRNAGQLPKLDAVTRALVGREDDFFFNLFVTHPDTMLRIERLYYMAEALAAQKKKQAK